jgi:uncharacterized protein YlxW (UPF0749 family)
VEEEFMKKLKLQIAVAIVFMLMGFLVTYQFKIINKKEKPENVDKAGKAEILAQIEKLKSYIEDVESSNKKLAEEIKRYEDMATKTDNSTKLIKDQLDNSRIILGLMDVEGPGIIITLSPKSSIFTKNEPALLIMDVELLSIVNELRNKGAEAISVNGRRITSRSGIKSSSNNSYILVNDEKISPQDRIEIKAIGPRSRLIEVHSYIRELHFRELYINVVASYDVKMTEDNSIKIPGYNKSYVSNYISLVE